MATITTLPRHAGFNLYTLCMLDELDSTYLLCMEVSQNRGTVSGALVVSAGVFFGGDIRVPLIWEVPTWYFNGVKLGTLSFFLHRGMRPQSFVTLLR